jgi:ankyrin repeat protein
VVPLPEDVAAEAAIAAIHAGDVDDLVQLLAAKPGLATTRVDGARTLLHVATDWPGHHPNVGDTVRALCAAGANVNARFIGRHSETPLHWAASSDDLEALDALLDLGADVDAPGGVIGGGTPLLDAAAFGQWAAGRRLIERGAVAGFFEAATFGLLPRLRELLEGEPATSAEEISDGFWGACHGGQRETAQYLLDHGAELNRVAWDDLTPLGAARRSGFAATVAWLEDLSAEPG